MTAMQSPILESPAVSNRAAAPKFVWIVVSVLLLLPALAGRVGMLSYPFLNDSGLYTYMGKVVAEGGVLYRDFFETKLPGVGLIASVFWRVFGSHWAGYVLSQLAMTLLAAGFLARAARRHIGAAAALPTFLYATVLLNFSGIVFTGFQLETLQVFFDVLAGVVALEALAGDDVRDSFLVGLASGVAVMLKPTGAAVAVAFVLVLFLQHKNRRFTHLAMLVGGMAIPTLVTAYYTLASGAGPYLFNVVHEIRLYAAGTPVNISSVIRVGCFLAVLLFPIAARAIAFALCSRDACVASSRPYQEAMRTSQLRSFALAWAFFAFAGALMQRRMYGYHFLPVVPALAMLYGSLPRPARPRLVLVGLLPIALLSLQFQGTDMTHLHRAFEKDALSQYISAHTNRSDSVYIDQIGRLLIETDLHPGSRYGTFFYMMNYDNAPQHYIPAMIADFEQRRPKYIMLGSDTDRARQHVLAGPILGQRPVRRENCLRAWKQLDQYIAGHYLLETAIDDQNVYRRIPLEH